MRLTDLLPRWITEVTAKLWRWDYNGPQSGAQGVIFLCPKCFTANAGPRGTHQVCVPFKDRGFPDDAFPEMDRWNATGTCFEDLTTTPSILLIGGCAWHGFITNGEVT